MWKLQFTAAFSCMETLQMANKSRLPTSAPSLKLKLKPPKTLPSVANKSIQHVHVFSGLSSSRFDGDTCLLVAIVDQFLQKEALATPMINFHAKVHIEIRK